MIKSTTINRQGVEWILEQPIQTQIEVLSNHLDICKAVINSLLNTAVEDKAGTKYCRVKPHDGQYSRWGINPGSVRVGNQKLSVVVPRIVDNETGKVDNIEMYDNIKDLPEQKEEMVMSVLKGISTRDYSEIATQVMNSFGLSSSSISRHFIEHSSKAVETFVNRSLEEHEFAALFMDGKYLSGEQMVIALGVTCKGEKIALDVVQSSTENSRAIKEMLGGIIHRGFKFEQGILVVIDGGKGIHKAVEETFGHYAVIQRCQWHKRENVVSYLKEDLQEAYRKALQKAYTESKYEDAKTQLMKIAEELKPLNVRAYNSLMEGLEETLTLHRLNVAEALGKSFGTTNIIESLNSQVDKHTRKVKRWINSDQRLRWVVMAVIEAEKCMHRVNGHKNIYLLQEALKKEIENKKIEPILFSGGTP